MLIIDDEDYFLEHSGPNIEWPSGVWCLVVGPNGLLRRGLAAG
jgi:hypothetical protein